MRKLHTRRGGFTLIELMIVVAIIGILAAIAIPNFLKFQLRSKTGEAKTNLAALRTAEEGYFAEYGVYVGRRAADPGAAGRRRSSSGRRPGVRLRHRRLGPRGRGVLRVRRARSAARPTRSARSATSTATATTSDFGYIHPDPVGDAIGAGRSTRA